MCARGVIAWHPSAPQTPMGSRHSLPETMTSRRPARIRPRAGLPIPRMMSSILIPRWSPANRVKANSTPARHHETRHSRPHPFPIVMLFYS
jgi:hypothetical protein